jgi:Lipid-A-disaccharide synthetase
MSEGGASPAWRASARPRRLLLVAGEASGDLHGADLVRALRASIPALEVFGVGGERLREAGMETVADVGQVATMGLKATGGCAPSGTPIAPWRDACATIRPTCAC